MASKLGVPLLASIPIHIDVCSSGDNGNINFELLFMI